MQLKIENKEWETPFPGFKIVNNLYYVGTYDLGCYLIDTGAGLERILALRQGVDSVWETDVLFPIGAAFAKGLTLAMGQTHFHRYAKPLLDRVRAGAGGSPLIGPPSLWPNWISTTSPDFTSANS